MKTSNQKPFFWIFKRTPEKPQATFQGARWKGAVFSDFFGGYLWTSFVL